MGAVICETYLGRGSGLTDSATVSARKHTNRETAYAVYCSSTAYSNMFPGRTSLKAVVTITYGVNACYREIM